MYSTLLEEFIWVKSDLQKSELLGFLGGSIAGFLLHNQHCQSIEWKYLHVDSNNNSHFIAGLKV